MSVKKHKLGIALSGGGVRGFFHAGLLQAFRERDINIDVISGTSAGAIAGSLYAVGADFQHVINRFPTHMRSLFFEPSLLFKAKFNPTRILKAFLEEFYEGKTFRDLPIQLKINAVNISTGETEIFKAGHLLEAVMASCAIPGVFNSFHENGNIYVDGGLTLNLPASVIRDDCQTLIGVNILSFQKRIYHSLPGRRQIVQRSVDIFHKKNNEKEEELCDYIISPPALSRFPTYDVSNKQILFDLGYDAGLEFDL